MAEKKNTMLRANSTPPGAAERMAAALSLRRVASRTTTMASAPSHSR
jgi:hypothetical protein